MVKQVLFKAVFSWLIVFLPISSCTDKENDTGSESTPTDNTPSSITPRGSIDISGIESLDTLWIEPSKFEAMKGKDLNFQFFIINQDILTLHGWSGKSKDYNGRPANIELLNGKKSNKKLGPKTYLSSLRISKKDIDGVIDSIKASHKAVLFAPNVTYSPTTKNRYISYKIFLSNMEPNKQSDPSFRKFTDKTGYELNPSPPRSFVEE
ncbi:hypothetical protein [Rufibacter tibetensis]|uniref:Uncharacterized protein n=1 Tax=Rufibacter tibetensis TaxID=512763 RepID=A0A0N7HWA4_9BACT|nr:hypothetical protein [Rufibacter tibetensis]ALI98696.1 hypothetical protein DC20_06585 [Rufibacter tibetensis]